MFLREHVKIEEQKFETELRKMEKERNSLPEEKK
jgi:hypothetical protein